MYEMLAIKRLFHRDSDFLTFKAITEEPIPDIRERRAGHSGWHARRADPGDGARSGRPVRYGAGVRQRDPQLGRDPRRAGVASSELARLLFTDFGDEMASRDEILKAADDPAAAPVSISVPPPRVPQATPPPIPLPATSGEMQHNSQRSKAPTGPQTPMPSMIVGAAQPQTGRVQLVDLDQVLDLSEDVGADAWMADGGTNLLAAHRWKAIRNTVLALAIFGALAVGIMLLGQCLSNRQVNHVVTAPTPVDAAVKQAIHDLPIDANDTKEHDDIIALSKFGFYSLTSNAKTTVYVDDKNIGETPLTRLPLKPGPHTVKAVGPRGKSKILKITIIGGRDTDSGSVDW